MAWNLHWNFTLHKTSWLSAHRFWCKEWLEIYIYFKPNCDRVYNIRWSLLILIFDFHYNFSLSPQSLWYFCSLHRLKAQDCRKCFLFYGQKEMFLLLSIDSFTIIYVHLCLVSFIPRPQNNSDWDESCLNWFASCVFISQS